MKKFLAKLFPQLPLIFPAIFSGFLLTLCFPPVSLWMFSFIAVVPLLVAILRVKPSRRESFIENLEKYEEQFGEIKLPADGDALAQQLFGVVKPPQPPES